MEDPRISVPPSAPTQRSLVPEPSRRRGVEQPIKKHGIRYETMRSYIHPLDLVLFAGSDFVSNMIKYAQAKGLKNKLPANYVTPGAFSHIGIIVTSEILSHPKVQPGKIYVWESTMSGKYGEGVNNIDGEWFLGVQLRDLDELFPVYDRPNDTAVAFAHLKPEHSFASKNAEERFSIKTAFTELFNKYNGIRYDYNPLSIGGSLFSCLRGPRDVSHSLFGDRWIFCSELVALIYKRLGIFPSSVIPDNMVPMDFVGYESDSKRHGGAPLVVSLPPTYVISELHDR